MKTGTMVAAVLAGLVALVCTVLVARQNGSLSVQKPAMKQTKEVKDHPKIAPHGPYPKAVFDESVFDFGAMQFGTRKSHTFVIRNNGKVPLEIRDGGSTCSCTVGKLTDGAVPPGESVKIEVSWKPYAPDDHFRQAAIVWTNDPEHKEINFAVTGTVEKIASIIPDRAWDVGLIADGKPVTVTGRIYSRLLDEFNVLEVSSGNPHIKGEAIKFNAKELTGLNAKSGWTIKATVLPGIPVGRLNATLTIKTDIKNQATEPVAGEIAPTTDASGNASYTLAVTGYRPGPMRIVPTAGITWNAVRSTIGLGSFRHEEGRTAKLFVYIGGLQGKQRIKVLGTECDLQFLDVQLDTKNVVSVGNQQRYLLTIRIPPGKLRMSRTGSDPVKVVLKTNHPELPVITLNIIFVSL